MPRAILLAGLGFGDEGKGTITQFLAKTHKADLVVRYNGGSQAAHNVYSEDGKHHTFAQFGSASFEGVPTYLSRYMLVEPHAIVSEARGLQDVGVRDPLSLLHIDRDALMISPYQWRANRVRELRRGDFRHGSCGMGIGETVADSLVDKEDALFVRDLEDPTQLLRKLRRIQERKVEEFKDSHDVSEATKRVIKTLTLPAEREVESYNGYTDGLQLVDSSVLKKAIERTATSTVLFEGAQGVLLDQDFGFHPYTTWSDCTFGNALKLLDDVHFVGAVKKVGVVRTFTTRHGQGPMPTEIKHADSLDRHNSANLWQGSMRAGTLDGVLTKYAIDVLGGIDEVALTHVDMIRTALARIACEYRSIEHAQFLDSSGRGKLRVNRPADLDYQERLGNAVSKMFVQHAMTPANKHAFIALLEDLLGVPVTVTSHGPRPQQKETRTGEA